MTRTHPEPGTSSGVPPQRIVRATVLDTPQDPFSGGQLRAEADAGIVVDAAGVVVDRGSYAQIARRYPRAATEDLRGGLLLPGLVDTHVHFPQIRATGALGLPLLEWLDRRALPEEARFVDPGYARTVAAEFTRALLRAGTTTALVFGAHFAPAVEEMFSAADRWGLRVTTGLVAADRALPTALLTTPQRSHDDAAGLIERWHGRGRCRYAVTPRFSYSSSEALLEACGEVRREHPTVLFTSHVNENRSEIGSVREMFPDARDYVDTYDRHGLLTGSAVLAHNVHPTGRELDVLAARGTAVAHCPTSNVVLGSGMFPLRRHREHGVPVALGSDVGAGTSLFMVAQASQAYGVQQLLGEAGEPLSATHLLYLATRAGALALGLGDTVGDLSVGRAFDAVRVLPAPGSAFDVGLRHARDHQDALARVFTLATEADIVARWIGGDEVAVA